MAILALDLAAAVAVLGIAAPLASAITSPAEVQAIEPAATAGHSTAETGARKRVPADSTPRANVHDFHAGAAFIQLGVLVGLGIGWYEWQIELNKTDFDFARTFDGQVRRLTTTAGYRFDDNERYLNIGHAPIGALYYQAARAHGAGMGTAYLFSVGTSTLWEVVVEHREVVSLNDQIFTGIGGAAIGEALYRISDVFARGKPTLVNRALMSLASPLRLGAWLSGEAPAPSGLYDRHGLDASTFHRFELSCGGVVGVGGPGAASPAAADRAWTATARGEFEVIALRGYAADGDADGDIGEGNEPLSLRGGELTRLIVAYSGDATRFRGFELFARTTLFGRADQNLRATPEGAHRTSRVVAAASAFELAYDRTGGMTDFLSFVHVIGPTLDYRWSSDGLTLRAEASFYGDFAMVRPMAIGAEAMPPVEGSKSTLATQQYYYGWGGTAAARFELAYRRFRAGASVEWNHIDSIEGLDRHQVEYVSPTGVAHAAIADDSSLTDSRVRGRLFLEVPIPLVDAVSVEVAGDLVHRSGEWSARSLAGTQDDRRVAVALVYTM